MSAPVTFGAEVRSELEQAEPIQRADSSSVLRSQAGEAHEYTEGALFVKDVEANDGKKR